MMEICPSFLWQQSHDAVCWKSACSSSSEFLCRKPVHCFLSIGPRKIRSAILEIWQPILSDGKAFFSLKPKVVCMASLTKSHPSPSVDLTLLEICLPFRPFFIAGNPSVLPPDLHCRKSICPSAHSSLPEICFPFRPIFIAGNLSSLPPILHSWKSVCPSA